MAHRKSPMRKALVELIKREVPRTPTMGIEIGVARGSTSHWLLKSLPRLHLVMVDPWEQDPHYEKEAREVQREFGIRARIIKSHSQLACRELADEKYDFVFIDGNHSFDAVLTDSIFYLPKIRAGGMMIWHDYGKEELEVTEAVDAFCEQRELKPQFNAKAHLAWI